MVISIRYRLKVPVCAAVPPEGFVNAQDLACAAPAPEDVTQRIPNLKLKNNNYIPGARLSDISQPYLHSFLIGHGTCQLDRPGGSCVGMAGP